MLENANKKLKEDMELIMDTFTGADGGGSYVNFCNFIEEFDRQVRENNDAGAKRLVQIVTHFASLIRASQSRE